MELLRDEQLIANLSSQNLADRYVLGVTLPEDRYSKDSSVQASSMDLHIGAVYIPGAKEQTAEDPQPKTDHVLQTGETAVVTTKEILNLPNTVAAFGFPPSSVSFKGLLMTNPGHVDPGYRGRLRFTVINMAKEPFALNAGDRIVSLLFFALDAGARRDWGLRNQAILVPLAPEPGMAAPDLPLQVSPNVRQSDVNRLSKDFVDVEQRAEKIAKAQGVQWSIFITGGVALIAALLQAFSSGHLFYRQDIDDLKKKQEMVEYDLKNRVDVERKLQDFDKRLTDIQREVEQLRPKNK